MQFNGKCGKFDPPGVPETSEAMVTKVGMGDDVGDPVRTPYNKTVLFYFYFSFITVVRAALVQLMNIVSNFIFHCNNCDASRVFVKFREGADQHGCRA